MKAYQIFAVAMVVLVSLNASARDRQPVKGAANVEPLPRDLETQLKLTDQSAFLDGRERPDERRSGWGKVLEGLADFLRSTSEPKEFGRSP
jgi:hypothetical protein